MSAKWRRVQAWDREHLTGWLTPVRLVLHALSTITLAIVLLVGVSLYAVFASVPVGMLVLGLDWVIYGLTLLLTAAVPAFVTAWLARRVVQGRAARFAATVACVIGGATLGITAWSVFAWPALHYDPVDKTGLRLFPAFVESYQNVTLRRLPAFEMTELEFYSWWPMQLMLGLFVINMVVATVRRIEFRFVNLGVLTVHTGIVTIGLGSLYYQMFKQEGDTILLAGSAVGGGIGPAQPAFFDREDPALWINAGLGWEQRSLAGELPRYNDYGLSAGAEGSARSELGFGAPIPTESDRGRSLRLSIDAPPTVVEQLGEDVRIEVIGYATYAEPATDWVPAVPVREDPNPLRMVYLVGYGDPTAPQETVPEGRRLFAFAMLPDQPSHAITDFPEFGLQYWIGLDTQRWERLATPAERPTAGLVIIELPDRGVRSVLPVEAQGRRVAIGDTGYTATIEAVLPEPPFPIITEGYEDATSSLVQVRLEPPDGPAFTRWAYHRFPEIDQDILDGSLEDGRPDRRDPDPAVRVTFIDQSKLQLYLNEDPETGLVDAIVRWPAGVRRFADVRPGSRIERPVDGLSFDLGERWADAREIQRPVSVPAVEREGDFIGTHDKAMIAVRVSLDGSDWSQTVWLPYARFMDVASLRADTQRSIVLPDGRWLALVFGRVQQRLPGFQLRLIDFEMLAYDHRGAPRDYQSLVRVEPQANAPDPIEPYDHVTKLNSPLKAPFLWSDARALPANIAGELLSHLTPTQFKFSQAGWDRSGWEQSQELVDQGLLDRPRASFTILGVGNNPGIHIIALGGVLMGVGTPWAFYVKPWLLRRQKRRIQRELAAGPAQAEPSVEPHPVGAAS
ncbi:MAG: hypothetical protein ACTS22_03415 [Phycisphaerales bacterium]